MLSVLAATAAGLGAYLLWSAVSAPDRAGHAAEGDRDGRDAHAGPTARPRRAHPVRAWLAQADLADVRLSHLAALCAATGAVGAVAAFAVFGGALPSAIAAVALAGLPLASLRARRRARLEAAQDNWPRLIEEIRLQTASLGRSVPQALFDVGQRAPVELRPAFEAARREWLLSTDFPRTLALLQHRLADPTADATCETLLVAHELGGAGLDRRLADLADDRRLDVQRRKDATAQQAGVRFTRKFTLLVPLGMAAVGLMISNGRNAYATTSGQLVAGTGILMVLACWWWAGRLLRLPAARRVFGP